jgi:hypothetical protein
MACVLLWSTQSLHSWKQKKQTNKQKESVVLVHNGILLSHEEE